MGPLSVPVRRRVGCGTRGEVAFDDNGSVSEKLDSPRGWLGRWTGIGLVSESETGEVWLSAGILLVVGSTLMTDRMGKTRSPDMSELADVLPR